MEVPGPRTTFTYKLAPSAGQQVPAADLDATVSILKSRALAKDSVDPIVTAVPPDQVTVELLNVTSQADQDAMSGYLSATGKLEFVLLPRDVYGYFDNSTLPSVPAEGDGAKPLPAKGDLIDPSLPAAFANQDLDPTGVRAAADENSPGTWSLAFAFTKDAGDRFADFTSQHVGDYFAIVVDGRVISVPYIRDAITGGKGEISGGFTEEEAKNLAATLRYRPLPVPLTLVSIEGPKPTVGPALVSNET